jgi:polyisoprenyl-teichoic acid--peptidoglycan teichoic acid transferase
MTFSRSIGARHRSGGLLIAASMLLAACSAAPSPTPTPTQPATFTPMPTASPSPTPSPLPTPVPRAVDEQLLHESLTLLIVGEDQSASRKAQGYVETNTDALMVLNINPNQSRIVMLSIPRDTVDVPLGNGQTYHGKINSIAFNYDLPTLQAAVSALLAVPIDAYLKIDMDDLVTLVDAVGGVDVDVQTHVQEPAWGLDLQPGPAHLTGTLALEYARTRHYDNDYARAARQEQVVLALVRKYFDPATDVSVRDLLAGLTAFRTNLDLAELATYVTIARRSSDAAVSATVLKPPRFATFAGIEQGTGRGWIMIPNLAAMRAYAAAQMGG